MLKNAKYIYDNVLVADEVNTTKKYCKPAQVGVDLTIKEVKYVISPGYVLTDKTYASTTASMKKEAFIDPDGTEHVGYNIHSGTYIIELNEGCKFGPNDTGYIILRSSLNRSGCSIFSAVWDPGYTSVDGEKVNTMSIRLTVDNPFGIFIEENARVAQLVVFENEKTDMYAGQWQGGQKVSKLV